MRKEWTRSRRTLAESGAVPVLFDENEKLDGKALCAREDYPKDTALVLGSLPKELLSELSLAVLSPGISIEEAFVSTLEEADIPVWGEIELAWNYEKERCSQLQARTERPRRQRWWARS